MLTLLIALLAGPDGVSPVLDDPMVYPECLWQAAPAEARRAALAARDRGSAQDAFSAFTPPPVRSRMTDICGLPAGELDTSEDINFSMFVQMRWLEPRLETRWSRETLSGAYSGLSESEVRLVWQMATVGEESVAQDRRESARAAVAKLYAPFGQSMSKSGQRNDLDEYLFCQLMIIILAQHRTGILPRTGGSSIGSGS
jgi:hypothetical protein